LLPLLKNSDYNLIITSDHGQMHFSKSSYIKIMPESELMNYLILPPWGSHRAQIVNVMNGKEKAFEDFFLKKYEKNALLVESEEAIKSGLFGRNYVDDKFRNRFGTHLIIPRKNEFFYYLAPGKTKDFERDFGQHSGLSSDEMEIR